MNYSRIFHELYLYSGENEFFNFGENGRVSRSNSGDLAGKCADFNSQQKIALRAEKNSSSVF